MHVITTNDVNDALYQGINYLLSEGVEESSRNGPVLVAPGPVCTVYTQPRNRVLYSAARDANPYFHVMEALWMLSGANDVEFVEYFAKNMSLFSDDGVTSWGAYGWRWRAFFGWDQLSAVINELKFNPTSRRCVLAMWDAGQRHGDGASHKVAQDQVQYSHFGEPDGGDFYVATHGGLDVPCNTHIYFDARGGVLNITVCNRSNDIIWGAYGANAVHMSFLLECMAAQIGVPVGVYRQVSNNFHAYLEKFSREKLEQVAHESDTLGRLPTTGPAIEPGFDEDLGVFMPWARRLIRGEDDDLSCDALRTAFLTGVARPMFDSWFWRKKGDMSAALEMAGTLAAPDWRKACTEWLERRVKK